jgi:integrase
MRKRKEVRKIKVHGQWRWQARVSHQGQRVSRICATEAGAKLAKGELLQQLHAEAEATARDGAQPATLALLCDAYVLDLEARGKGTDTIKRVRESQRRLADFFGSRMRDPVTSLTTADLFAFRAWRLQAGVKPSTINRDLLTARAMLKKVRPDFRFSTGIFFPEDETRVRWLEPLQEVDVMSRLRSPFRQIAQLAALTLMRLSEIRRLRREQVALSQGVLQLPKTKTGPGTVTLSAEAQRILQEQLGSHSSEWVFPSPNGGPYTRDHVSRQWRRAARAAGLQDFHFHDLRHHGATMALNAGFSAQIVMALGRWKTERMMRRYAAVTDKTLRAAAEAVSGNLPGSGNVQWQQRPNPAPSHQSTRSGPGVSLGGPGGAEHRGAGEGGEELVSRVRSSLRNYARPQGRSSGGRASSRTGRPCSGAPPQGAEAGGATHPRSSRRCAGAPAVRRPRRFHSRC